MGIIETIIMVVIAFGVIVAIFSAIFKKKKSSKKEPEAKNEAKVEPVYKKQGEEQVKEERTEEVKKEESLKVIRKQSNVKINKKAVKTDSRNPSITKVFVNGKRVDDKEVSEEKQEEVIVSKEPIINKQVNKDVGRFGTREPEIRDLTEKGEGMPNRSPILTDRTDFGSHLVINKDNNLSGVAGTGIKQAVERSESQGKDIDSKTDEMINNIRLNMLGDRNYKDPMSFLSGSSGAGENKGQSPSDKLKKIDAETLILADVVANRKGKKK